MDKKRMFVRLLLIGAGGGCLALAIFAGQPWLTALVAPRQPLEPLESEAIIGEVLEAPGAADDAQAAGEGTPVVSPAIPPQVEETLKRQPLVARRHNGEEVPVLFPAAGKTETGEEDVAAGGLPPILTPEEVAMAMSHSEVAELLPVDEVDEQRDTPKAAEAQPVAPPVVVEKDGGQELQDDEPSARPAPTAEENPALPPGAEVPEWPGDSHAYEMTLPPLSATHEVQAFLRDLGYAPGPLDGIWGKRTEAAWRQFMRDTASAEAIGGMRRSRPSDRDPAAMAPSSDDQTSIPIENCTVLPIENCTPLGKKGGDEGRDGGTQAERAPEPPAQEVGPVRLPGTLRGVMGYRLPLVSRQEVPDQVVSGVLIPAHTTFVVLRGGEWELVDLKPEELERLRAEQSAVEPEPRPSRRGWNPLRLFRRTAPAAAEE